MASYNPDDLIYDDTSWKCRRCPFWNPLGREHEATVRMIHRVTFPNCPQGNLQERAIHVTGAPGRSELSAGLNIQASNFQGGDVRATPGGLEVDAMYETGGERRSERGAGLNIQASSFPGTQRETSQPLSTTGVLQSDSVICAQRPPTEGLGRDAGLGIHLEQSTAAAGDWLRPAATVRRQLDQPSSTASFESRITAALDLIRFLRCAVCLGQWRNMAVTTCRHTDCCNKCYLRISGIGLCPNCRGRIIGRFSVNIHSERHLDNINIPLPANLVIFRQMGFSEDAIRWAVRIASAGGIQPSDEDIISVLVDPTTPSSRYIPSLDELESILTDEFADREVKLGICKYLNVISRCLYCGRNPPNMCFLPCSHLSICKECFDRQPRPTHCPECNEPIENHVMVFI